MLYRGSECPQICVIGNAWSTVKRRREYVGFGQVVYLLLQAAVNITRVASMDIFF